MSLRWHWGEQFSSLRRCSPPWWLFQSTLCLRTFDEPAKQAFGVFDEPSIYLNTQDEFRQFYNFRGQDFWRSLWGPWRSEPWLKGQSSCKYQLAQKADRANSQKAKWFRRGGVYGWLSECLKVWVEESLTAIETFAESCRTARWDWKTEIS